MEEIARVFNENKTALDRVMKVKLDQETSTVVIGMGKWLSKILVIPLWILLGLFLLVFVYSLFTTDDFDLSYSDYLLVEGIFLFLAFLCGVLIRTISFKKTIDLANAKFEFKGQLRKNRTHTLAEYEGAETLRTIKDFPEEFVVKFKTDKGVKRYKLADLNMGYAKNIEPNHEAVCAFWDAIIQTMTNSVAPDTE